MNKTSWPSALLLSLVLAVSLPGCSKPTTEQQWQQARAFADKGEKKAAIIELKNLLADRPDHAAARLLLGQLYLDTGDAESAAIELKKAIDNGADPVAAAAMQARAHLARNEPAKALAALDPQRLPGQPDAPQLLSLRAQALVQSGKIAQAEQLFQSALQRDPGSADAALGLARLALVQRQPEQALARVDAILQRQPQHADSLLLKADLLRAKGDKAGAKAMLQQVIATDRNKTQAWLGLIALALDAGQTSEARKQLAELRKIGPDTLIARHFESLILLQENKPDQALALALDILKSAPGFPPGNLLAANIEYGKGLYQQATTHLTAILSKTPGHLPARRLLIATLLKQGELDKANAQLTPLLEQHPDDAALLNLAGEVAVRRKDYAKAMEVYSRAARLAPQNTEVQTRLAMTKLASGDANEGLHDLEQLALKDGKAVQADMVLALTHINKQQWPQAEAATARLASKQPDSPLPGVLRASILLGRKDVAGARKALDATLQKHPGFVPAAVNLARMDLADKQPEKALQRFETLLAKDGKNVDLIMAYAEFLQLTGKAGDAQSWLEKAHQARPEAIQPTLALTAIAMRNKDAKRALELAQSGVSKKPDSPALLDNLAMVQLASGDTNQALATFAKLVKVAPTAPASYIKLARAQAQSGASAAAIDSLQKAISLNPGLIDPYVWQAELLRKQNKHQEALAVATRLQSQLPKSAAGHLLAGDLLMQAGKPAEAAAGYTKAAALDPAEPLAALRLSDALFAQGKKTDAEAVVAKWLKVHPQDVQARLHVADQLMRQQAFKAAISRYEEVLQLQPRQLAALNNLAFLYHQQRDPRALALAEQALSLQPELPAVQDTIAMILLDTGQAPRALALLENAAKAAPGQPDIQLHLAQALARNAQKQRAQAVLQALSPDMRRRLDQTELNQLESQLK